MRKHVLRFSLIVPALAAQAVALETPAGKTDGASDTTRPESPANFSKMAWRFAELMIEHGRDRYGRVHSPLFATMLSRKTHAIFNYPFRSVWH